MKANEQLAEHLHLLWSGWMRYLFIKSDQNSDGSITIPRWVERNFNSTFISGMDLFWCPLFIDVKISKHNY